MPDVGKHQGLLAGQDGTPSIPDHTLLCPIGEGSYGDVWLAKNAVGTLRAVKIIHRSRFRDHGPYEREFTGLKHFEPISRTHEGFVDILQVGRDDQAGVFYYIMEAADPQPPPPDLPSANSELRASTSNLRSANPDLSYRPATLESLTKSQGRVPAAESIRIAGILAGALHHLHGLGLVHRDIKPSNIIFVGGVPKLADVGLVTRADSARTFVGTEGFLPPEGPGTVQADIFSLGKCLYEMAMGKDRQAFPSPPTLLGEMPDRALLLELNEIINRACAPDPKNRYASAKAMFRDLAFLEHGGSLKNLRRQKRRFRLGALILLGGCALIAAAAWLGRHRIVRVASNPPPAGLSAVGALVGRFGNKEELCVFYAARRQLCVSELTGEETIPRQDWFGEPTDFFGPSLLADVDGDGNDNLIISTRSGTHLALRILNDRLYEATTIGEMGGLVSLDGTNAPTVPWSQFLARRFSPATNGLPPRLLTEVHHGYATNQTRQVRMVALTNGTPTLWRFEMAASASAIAAGDLTSDGLEDFALGTSASCNGVRLGDGRDDEHSDLILLRHDGSAIAKQVIAGPLTDCEPIIWRGDQEPVVFVRCTRAITTSYDSQRRTNSVDANLPPEGHLLKFTKEGRRLASWSTTNEIESFLVARLDPDRKPVVITSDGTGHVSLFDSDTLQPIRSPVLVTPRKEDYVHLHLVGAEDLNGDGSVEIALLSAQITLPGYGTMGRPNEKPSIRVSTEAEVILLDRDLNVLARRVFESNEIGRNAPWVRLIRSGPKQQPFLFVSDRALTLLRFE